MYTVTFYSFKGGVGRTLALVNVATELATKGHNVLLIDFDLEAPGLSTFDLLAPPNGPHPGMVEFIAEYLRTGRTPNLEPFVYQSKSLGGDQGGRIWVMPAGREDPHYREALAHIDWDDLYNQHNGFLFFEDTKRQIARRFAPDYLLIDSRTGHSDVEGICTRQLPDAVVAMFFPNEQNLQGLKTVSRTIKAEASTGLRKSILIHYVMSNVPDLDDEDAILRRKLRTFRDSLEFERLAATIHRYESLSLLNQSVFSIDRPRSRLARDYRRLVSEIIASNPGSKLGALKYLEKRRGATIPPASQSDPDAVRLADILKRFPRDPDVLFATARTYVSEGSIEQAVMLLDQALTAEPDSAEGRVERASCLQRLAKPVEAADDLAYVCINITEVSPSLFLQAFRNLLAFAPDRMAEVTSSPSFMALDSRFRGIVINELANNDATWRLGAELLEDYMKGIPEDDPLRSVWRALSLLLMIRSGRWDDAIALVDESDRRSDVLGLAWSFNLAAAVWGKTGNVPRDLFKSVLEIDKNVKKGQNPNREQCLSLANWATGAIDESVKRLDAAIQLAQEEASKIFSCWRYALVTPRQFCLDCDEMGRMIQGEDIRPAFLSVP